MYTLFPFNRFSKCSVVSLNLKHFKMCIKKRELITSEKFHIIYSDLFGQWIWALIIIWLNTGMKMSLQIIFSKHFWALVPGRMKWGRACQVLSTVSGGHYWALKSYLQLLSCVRYYPKCSLQTLWVFIYCLFHLQMRKLRFREVK